MKIWIQKYVKRFFCQKIFLVLLIVLPIGTFFFAYLAHRDSTSVKVGIVADSENAFSADIKSTRRPALGQRLPPIFYSSTRVMSAPSARSFCSKYS